MEKYRTDKYLTIKKLEVIKETPKSITYKEVYKTFDGIIKERVSREMKSSRWCSWHNTFVEAKSYLIKLKIEEINYLQRQINNVEEQYEKVKLLHE